MRKPPAAVDVVVPVYKGLAETRACLQSVLAAAGHVRPRLVVVNDASPDPRLADWLRELAEPQPPACCLAVAAPPFDDRVTMHLGSFAPDATMGIPAS